VKTRHDTALALILMSSCGPSIKQSPTLTEVTADRAERLAALAETMRSQQVRVRWKLETGQFRAMRRSF
jgi:hypothetical protein